MRAKTRDGGGLRFKRFGRGGNKSDEAFGKEKRILQRVYSRELFQKVNNAGGPGEKQR